jgi:hypothetical protein
MENITQIGQRFCSFKSDYTLKWRLVTKSTDARVWLEEIDYAKLTPVSKAKYEDRLGTFTATTNGTGSWFTYCAKDLVPWLTFSLAPCEGRLRPGVHLDNKFPLSSGSVSTHVRYYYGSLLPELSGKYSYQAGNLRLSGSLSLGVKDGYTITGQALVLRWVWRGIQSRFVWGGNETQATGIGASFSVAGAKLGVSVMPRDVRVLGEYRRAKWGFGFAIAPASGYAVGARYSYNRDDYVDVAWHSQGRAFVGKWKIKLSDRFEAAAVARAQQYLLGKWSFGASVCYWPEFRPPPLKKMLPHAPIRA